MERNVKTGSGAFKSTEIGKLNRHIEKSVSGVFQGEKGSTGKAIAYAKKREILLSPWAAKNKIPA